jgi:GxxExxY protein
MHPVRSLQWAQESHQTNLKQLTEKIIGAAIRIHRRLGPGLLESAYETCLVIELQEIGLRVEQQKAVPLIYGTVKLECGFRADLVVDRRVVVELKCKEALHPVDHAQVLSHLRLLGLQVGLLINFKFVVLKDGVRRIVIHYDENLESQSAQRKSAEDAEET